MGFLADPNDFAQALLMVLPMLGLAWRPGRAFRNFVLVLIPGAILLYAVYLTHSRGALVGLAVMLFMAARQRWGTIRALMAATVPVALGLFCSSAAADHFRCRTNRMRAGWTPGAPA